MEVPDFLYDSCRHHSAARLISIDALIWCLLIPGNRLSNSCRTGCVLRQLPATESAAALSPPPGYLRGFISFCRNPPKTNSFSQRCWITKLLNGFERLRSWDGDNGDRHSNRTPHNTSGISRTTSGLCTTGTDQSSPSDWLSQLGATKQAISYDDNYYRVVHSFVPEYKYRRAGSQLSLNE